MKILLGDFNTKVGRENIFKAKMRMRIYIRIVRIIGVKIVNFVT
jgi:hypothetical protein